MPDRDDRTGPAGHFQPDPADQVLSEVDQGRPALFDDVSDWIKENVRGEYILESYPDASSDDPELEGDTIDKIHFKDEVDYMMFKLRWIG